MIDQGALSKVVLKGDSRGQLALQGHTESQLVLKGNVGGGRGMERQ